MPFPTVLRRALSASAAAAILVSGPALSSAAAQTPDPDGEAAKSVASVVTIRPLPPAWVLPVSGYHLTGTFGASSALWSSTHTGLDFATAVGTPIVSVTDGVVTEVGYDGAYGNKTVVRAEDGTEFWYCHQDSQQVAVGQEVSAGEVIGEVGATGNVTGAHLHLEVRPSPDVPVDPFTALTEHGLHP